MTNWATAILILALIAGAIGCGVLAGTPLAVAKILFVTALLAFLVWGVVGVSRRGAP